jgi:hypothetical protein
MAQQINLYQREAKKETKWFSFKQLMQAMIGLAVILALVTLFETYQHFMGEKVLTKLEQEKAQTNERMLETVRKAGPMMSRDQIAKATQDKLHEKAIEMEMIATLKNVHIVGATGFARYLRALAERRTLGVWLTNFSFNNDTDQILLSGKTVSPEFIPQFLENLSLEQPFKGKTFQVFKIALDEKDNYISFIMQTKGANK